MAPVSHFVPQSSRATIFSTDISKADRKPGNVFLVNGEVERVKLLDFGIARAASQPKVTHAGMVVGTPDYMAPEQMRAGTEVDRRVDFFSLGCVLFECLVGRPPFGSEHPMGVFAKVLFEPAPPLRELRPDLPEPLEELVATLLAKDPAQRPQSAAEVAEQLQMIAASSQLPNTSEREPARRAMLGRQALTGRELRLLCLGVMSPYGTTLASASTQSEFEQTALLEQLRSAGAPFGARIEPLPDGSVLFLLETKASAAEQAELAAHCALHLHAVRPEVPIALCLGHSDLLAELLDAHAVERAAAMLKQWPRQRSTGPKPIPPAPILIEEPLRGLLGQRFAFTKEGELTALTHAYAEGEPHLTAKTAPLLGRDAEMGQLQAALQGCLDEPQAVALLLTADAGMGKSRLCQEFLEQVRTRHADVAVWIGRADPSSAGSPFGLIAQTLRRALGIVDDEPPPARLAHLQTWLEPRIPPGDRQRILEFMGELLGAMQRSADETSPQLLAARRDPLLMGDQLRRAFCDFLGAQCRAQPLLLVLEDLHWGDLPTVNLLDAALRSLPDAPLMLLALARPQIHEQFPRLWQGRRMQELRLERLGRKASERIVAALLGPGAEPEQLAALAERAAGNAFFLEELAHAASEGRLAEHAAEAAVPESLLAIVQARILRVDTDARKALRAASVFGQVFWPGGVDRLLGQQDGAGGASLSDRLEVLLARDLISQRPASRFHKEPEYCFRHALVREAAYAMLTESDRRLGHRLAWSFLQQAGETDALVLADHLERGGETERAVIYYESLVNEALEGNDFAAALAYAERAIQHGAQGEAAGELRSMQAEAHLWRGELQQAQDRALAALDQLSTASEHWFRAITTAAIAAGRRLELSVLGSLRQKLAPMAERGERSDAYVAAAVRLGLQSYIAGQYEPARELFQRIETLIAQHPGERAPATEAMLCIMRANRATYEWKLDLSADWFEKSAELYERAGDLRSAASEWLDAAMFCSDIAAFTRMERLLRRTIATAEQLGLARLLAVAHNTLANALWRLGRLDEALPLCLQALRELETQGDARVGGVCLQNLTRIHLARGELEEAQRYAEEAVQKLSGLPRFQARALALLAHTKLARQQPEEAMARAQQALDILLRLGRIGTDEAVVRLVHVRALLALGDQTSAREAAAVARARLLEQAAAITTEAARQQFLCGLPENAQLLQLTEQLQS